MTQAIAINEAQKRGEAELYQFESAGWNPGRMVEEKAIDAVNGLHLDSSAILSRQPRSLKDELKKRAWDVIVALDSDSKDRAVKAGADPKRVRTLRELAGEEGDVTDPYGQPSEIYAERAREILGLLEKGWKNMSRNPQKPPGW